jgi:hypothetical protein
LDYESEETRSCTAIKEAVPEKRGTDKRYARNLNPQAILVAGLSMRNVLTFSVIVAVASANATTVSDFKLADIKGLTVTETNPLKFTLGFSKPGTVTVGGKTYTLKEVYGVYKIAHTGKFTAATSKSAPYGWSNFNLNTGKNLVGWYTTSTTRSIKAYGTGTFEFKTLTSAPGSVVNNGFKVRVTDKNNCDYTMYVYSKSFAPVPEPTSMAILGIGGLAFLRRRFKKN